MYSLHLYNVYSLHLYNVYSLHLYNMYFLQTGVSGCLLKRYLLCNHTSANIHVYRAIIEFELQVCYKVKSIHSRTLILGSS